MMKQGAGLARHCLQVGMQGMRWGLCRLVGTAGGINADTGWARKHPLRAESNIVASKCESAAHNLTHTEPGIHLSCKESIYASLRISLPSSDIHR